MKKPRFVLRSSNYTVQLQRIDPAIQELEDALVFMLEQPTIPETYTAELHGLIRSLVSYREKLFQLTSQVENNQDL